MSLMNNRSLMEKLQVCKPAKHCHTTLPVVTRHRVAIWQQHTLSNHLQPETRQYDADKADVRHASRCTASFCCSGCSCWT